MTIEANKSDHAKTQIKNYGGIFQSKSETLLIKISTCVNYQLPEILRNSSGSLNFHWAGTEINEEKNSAQHLQQKSFRI
jgi:hypothetical protein